MPKYSNYIYDNQEAINMTYISISACYIFLMQAGFAMIENGSVRIKNSSSILIKNMFDACWGAITFWLIGYGVAWGFH
jgi:Amt family ammonium transporter